MQEGVEGLLRDKTRKPGKAPLLAERGDLRTGDLLWTLSFAG